MAAVFFGASVSFLTVVLIAVFAVSESVAQRQLVEIAVVGFGETRVDRCPTCHTISEGVELPDEHPAVPGYHPVERFGCSSCHGGEPRAAEQEFAHHGGREPLLHLGSDGERRLYRIEAGCARCHTERVDGALAYDEDLMPHVAQGRELFVSRGCWGCHRIVDLSSGERGPELSDVASRLDGEAIWQAIEDPSAAPSSTTMPNFRLDDGELEGLVTFLLAQVDSRRQAAAATARILNTRRPGAPPEREPVNEAMAQGGQVMLDLGCAGCHRLQSRDGQVGPDLRWESELRGPRYLQDMITRPALTVVGSRMPPLDLTESEVAAAREFLSRQREIPPESEEEAWREICARCHGLDGRGRTAVAPYLARRPRNLASETFFRGVRPARIVNSLRHGIPGTPMAPWAQAVPVLGGKRVVSFIARELHHGALPSPPRPTIPRQPEKIADATGEAAEQVFRVECVQCHGPDGRGDGPEAAGLQPLPRDLGNGAYIAGLSDQRIFTSINNGPPGSAMPSHEWGTTGETIWALVAKVRELAGEPLTGSYGNDRWPWQRQGRRRRSRRPRRRSSKGRSNAKRGESSAVKRVVRPVKAVRQAE